MFEPKPLAAKLNWQDLRYSMVGAAYLSEGLGFSKLNGNARANILWEVAAVRKS